MEILNLKLSEIKPYERNAKKHDEKQIKNVMESINHFGFVQPVVVDKNNVLIIGHCRTVAAKRLHMKEVPCYRMEDLTEEQVDKLRLLDNKLNESKWNFDLLNEDIPELDFMDFEIDWGIDDLLDDEMEIIENEILTEPITQKGDSWILGQHRITCGSSTKEEIIKTLIECEQTNQKCCMCELDQKDVDDIVQRYIDFKKQSDNVYLIRDGKKIKYQDLIEKENQ